MNFEQFVAQDSIFVQNGAAGFRLRGNNVFSCYPPKPARRNRHVHDVSLIDVATVTFNGDHARERLRVNQQGSRLCAGRMHDGFLQLFDRRF